MSTPTRTGNASSLSDVGPLLVVALVTRLRVGGVPVSTSEVLDAMASLIHTDLTSRERVRAALRTTLVKDASHDVLFRRSFDAIFPRQRREPHAAASTTHGETADEEDELLESVVRALREDDPEDVEHALGEAINRFSGAVSYTHLTLPTIYSV